MRRSPTERTAHQGRSRDQRTAMVVLLALTAGLCVGALTVFAWQARRAAPKTASGGAQTAETVPSQADDVNADATQHPAEPRPKSMRARVQEAIAAARVESNTELEAYLDSLEQRARAQGAVTALEVEPGVAMIERHWGPDAAQEYTRRMARLQRELSHAELERAPDPAELQRELEASRKSIVASSGMEKQLLIKQYIEAVQSLPEDDQEFAMQDLRRLLPPPTRPDAAAADALLSGIEDATDEGERQDLIREYMTYVAQFPSEEYERRVALLRAE